MSFIPLFPPIPPPGFLHHALYTSLHTTVAPAEIGAKFAPGSAVYIKGFLSASRKLGNLQCGHTVAAICFISFVNDSTLYQNRGKDLVCRRRQNPRWRSLLVVWIAVVLIILLEKGVVVVKPPIIKQSSTTPCDSVVSVLILPTVFSTIQCV